MAEPKPESKIPIPPKSIAYIALCVILVILFVFAAYLPTEKWSGELDTQTAEAKFRLHEQQTLTPVFQYLKVESEKVVSDTLPLPPKGKLARTMINNLPQNFAASAKNSGMSLVMARPDLSGLKGDFQSLPVNIVLRGDFINFRKFLIGLGGMPYVERIEEILIKQAPDTKEFNLRVWVAIG
jgi:Tfp pilus assembly protein PilO